MVKLTSVAPSQPRCTVHLIAIVDLEYSLRPRAYGVTIPFVPIDTVAVVGNPYMIELTLGKWGFACPELVVCTPPPTVIKVLCLF